MCLSSLVLTLAAFRLKPGPARPGPPSPLQTARRAWRAPQPAPDTPQQSCGPWGRWTGQHRGSPGRGAAGAARGAPWCACWRGSGSPVPDVERGCGLRGFSSFQRRQQAGGARCSTHGGFEFEERRQHRSAACPSTHLALLGGRGGRPQLPDHQRQQLGEHLCGERECEWGSFGCSS